MSWEPALFAEAQRHGFTLWGVAPAAEADGFPAFCDWLDRGFGGAMGYLDESREVRRHPQALLESVQSVVMLGWEYGPAVAPTDSSGRVASYAQHDDYHPVLWAKLNAMSAWLGETYPGTLTRGVADSAPLLERDFARRAGLGWVGKNAMLLNKSRGSFFLLAGLLTSLETASAPAPATNHCGTCTRCLDACPTQAFAAPGVLDARKCVSYLTIELRGPIPLELREGVGDWLFGCDVCQDVCPWNRHAGPNPGFGVHPELVAVDPVELVTMPDAEFRRRFRGTPFMRAKRAGLARNACVVLGNRRDPAARPALEAALADEDAAVREAAAWALGRLEEPNPPAPFPQGKGEDGQEQDRSRRSASV